MPTLGMRDVGYTLISRFEEAFRLFISDTLAVIYGSWEEGVPPITLSKASDRASRDDWVSPEDLLENVDFPDLKDICCYRGAFSAYFPYSDMTAEDFTRLMNELYPLRCKIAHVRQHFGRVDLARMAELTQEIAKELQDPGRAFLEFSEQLERSPQEMVVPMPVEFCISQSYDRTPNNVPIPDFEYEGGFVGRTEDIRKIMQLLDSRREVITISGAGGVGKTAVALRVLQTILQNPNPQYDGIIWLSAKETRLSYLGIEDVEPSLKSYDELLDTILDVMGFPSSGSRPAVEKEDDVKVVFDLYKRILIAIDNLETITDERIIEFILDPHPNTKILITSRRGLGQVERRHELKQLKEAEAIHLFRLIAREKNLGKLASMTDAILRTYVNRLSCYPLAMKWVIGQVAIGKDMNAVIEQINERTSDISLFCFDQVFNSVSESAKRVLCALSLFDTPPPAGVLNYVVDLREEDLEDGLQELILVSLVIPEQYQNEQSQIATRYSLLSLTRGYVRQQLDHSPEMKRSLIRRLEEVQSNIEELGRARQEYRAGLANLGAVTEEEKIAAAIAQNAFQKYQAGLYGDAVEDYRRAIQIAPQFASPFRNWAAMEAQEQHYPEADSLAKKAAELNPEDPMVWLTWGNIKRKQNKLQEALEKYERAHSLAPEDVFVLNALGQAKSRLGLFSEAHSIFTSLLTSESISVQGEIVNRYSLVRNLKRWAEELEERHQYLEAKELLLIAVDHCQSLMDPDRTDQRSADIVRSIYLELGFVGLRAESFEEAVEAFSKVIVHKPVGQLRYQEARDTYEAASQGSRVLYRTLDRVEDAKKMFPRELTTIRDSLRRHVGLSRRVEALKRELYNHPGYISAVSSEGDTAVIQSKLSEGPTYSAHISQFEQRLDTLSEELVGKNVLFEVSEKLTSSGMAKEAIRIRWDE